MTNYLQQLVRDSSIAFDNLVQSITDTLYQAFEAGELESNLLRLGDVTNFEPGPNAGDWLIIKNKEALRESIRAMLDDLI